MADNGCKRIVFSSSATVYGKPESVPIREDFPLSQYSNSLPLLTDENHDFQYWHNGVNRVYRDNYITSDTTLTALWYPKKKELTYYIGSRSVKTDYFYYSETPSKLVYEPSGSDGENLLGWRKFLIQTCHQEDLVYMLII